jgi:hypothetical protein
LSLGKWMVSMVGAAEEYNHLAFVAKTNIERFYVTVIKGRRMIYVRKKPGRFHEARICPWNPGRGLEVGGAGGVHGAHSVKNL